jgi:hypothetical protein
MSCRSEASCSDSEHYSDSDYDSDSSDYSSDQRVIDMHNGLRLALTPAGHHENDPRPGRDIREDIATGRWSLQMLDAMEPDVILSNQQELEDEDDTVIAMIIPTKVIHAREQGPELLLMPATMIIPRKRSCLRITRGHPTRMRISSTGLLPMSATTICIIDLHRTRSVVNDEGRDELDLNARQSWMLKQLPSEELRRWTSKMFA